MIYHLNIVVISHSLKMEIGYVHKKSLYSLVKAFEIFR